MPTSTSNYSFQKPLVDDPTDEDLWGGYLNDDLDDLDTLMRQGICNTLSASQTTGFTAVATISVRNFYRCDATGGAFAATLPTAASAGNGATVAFKKTDASANAITVTRAGADTIDGATTKAISIQYDLVILVSDGVSAWSLMSTTAPSVFTGDSGSGGTTGLVPAPAAGDTAANKFLKASGAWVSLPEDVTQGSPSAPSGTSSTTGVMMGLAQSFTPTATTRLLVIISGNMANSSGSGAAKMQIRYGTGAAPSNGAAITGTAAGGLLMGAPIGSTGQGFCSNAIITGLSLNTAYWFDISLAAVTTGTASATELSVSILEV